jgi:two-component system, LytTR family, sensor histidine kinase AlgZ
MPVTRLLSTLPKSPAPVWPDTCQPGVVLRVVLLTQALLALDVLINSTTLTTAVRDYMVLTAATLPASLLWLVLGCAASKIASQSKHAAAQHPVFWLALLGAFCAIVGSCVLWLFAVIPSVRWLLSALTGACLAGLFSWAWIWRTRALQPSSTQARLSELQARIRPHFLFNTLNSAIALVRHEPARAEALLEDLSDLFRQSMRNPEDTNTLAEELDLARRYLDIEKARFGERLRETWAIEPDSQTVRLPSLILQPLLENAVRHGVEPSETGADIEIHARKRAGMVLIRITNTLPGGSGKPGHGLALENTRQRLSLMHDVQSHFSAREHDGKFEVIIEVPA